MKIKSRFSLSKSAVIGCLIAVSAFTSTNITAFATDTTVSSDVNAVNTQASESTTSHNFLVDAKVKNYKDLNKASKIAGFNFKVPEYAADGFTADSGINMIKEDENKSYLSLGFVKTDKNNDFTSYYIEILKEKPEDFLSNVYKDSDYGDTVIKNKISSSEKTLGSIKGQDITIVESYSHENEEVSADTSNYFSWEDDGVYYLINYKEEIKNSYNESGLEIINISEENLSKIVNSMKDTKEFKDGKYFSDSIWGEDFYGIYDAEDLENAAKALKFTPKFISSVDERSELKSAEIRKNDDKLAFTMYYNYEGKDKYDDNYFELIEMKDDSEYNDIKNGSLNLYKFDKEYKKESKSEKITINNKDVYKIKEEVPEEYQAASDEYKYVYMWEDNGLYYKVENTSQEKSFDNDLETIISKLMNK